MRILHAFGIVAFALALAAPATANGPAFRGEFLAPMSGPISHIEVVIPDELIDDSGLFHRRNRENTIHTDDAESLKASLRQSLEQRLSSHDLYQPVNGRPQLTLKATIIAVYPSEPALTGRGKAMQLDPFGVSRGGASVEAQLFDENGALVGTFAYDYMQSSAATRKTGTPWLDAERTFDRFARRLAEVLAEEGGLTS